MTDIDLLEKKLALIETSIRELQTLIQPADIPKDLRTERFAEHTLQIAIQAAQDAASHIVSDDHLGEPKTNKQLFDLLARHGWLPDGMAEVLKRMVGFRNLLVHGYEVVDPVIVQDIVEHGLADLQSFVEAIRQKIASRPS